MGLDEENIPNDSDPLIQRQIESSQPPEGLDKIKDEEADAGSCACCRICLENESFPGEFISSTKLFSCHIALGAALLIVAILQVPVTIFVILLCFRRDTNFCKF